MNRRISISLLAAAVLLGGCIEDESLILPEASDASDLFRRYVSMGNSLTAGFMSGGINDSTQRQAYPVLIAQRAGAGFSIPSLVMPGCPPPLIGVLDTVEVAPDSFDVVVETDRVAGGAPDWCALRATPIPESVQNVAVPGARMADAFDITREGSATNSLTTLLLGGLSQVSAMRQAQPSLVTSWLGNNDVLAAALRGDPSLMTPADTFEFYWTRVASGIGGASPVGVVIIGIIDVRMAGALQPGLYYWAADSLGFSPKPVSADCAPTDELGAANPLSMNTVSFLAYSDPSVTEVSCDPSADYVLTRAESDSIADRMEAFNTMLASEASQRGWIYVDATAVLNTALLGTGGRQRLRRCTGLDNTDSLEDIVTIVTTQCPHESAPNFFGSLLTFDGVHMSLEAHQIMANAIVARLNSEFGTSL